MSGERQDRSVVAKVRVYELAKEFGVESKAVMDQLKEMGEFVRSASSTIEAPVVRRLKEAFAAPAANDQKTASAAQDQQAARPRPAARAQRRNARRRPDLPRRRPARRGRRIARRERGGARHRAGAPGRAG